MRRTSGDLRLAVAAWAVALAVLAGATVARAAPALWDAGTRNADGTVSSATVGVSLGGVAALDTAHANVSSTWKVLPLTVTNTGTAPLTTIGLATAVTGSSSIRSSIGLALWTGSPCGAAPPAGASTSTFAAPPPLPTVTPVAAGASATVCAAVRLTGTWTSLRGKSATATLTLTGSVGTWTATSTPAATTQSTVWPLTCTDALIVVTNLLDLGVTVSWPAVTGQAGYFVYNAAGTRLATLGAAATSVNLTYQSTLLGGTPVGTTSSVRIVPFEGTAAAPLESVGTSIPIHNRQVLGLRTARCTAA